MTVVHWKPLNTIAGLQDEMNRLFTSYFSQSPETVDTETYQWNPPVDIYEDKESIQVICEVPGIEKEDVTISIQENVLTLSGIKKRRDMDDDGSFYRAERLYGTFRRSFSLPSSVDQEKVRATYKNGVLTILLPRAEEAKPREVSIAVK